jgi:hypothetical protein
MLETACHLLLLLLLVLLSMLLLLHRRYNRPPALLLLHRCYTSTGSLPLRPSGCASTSETRFG